MATATNNAVPNGTYKLKLGKSFLNRPKEFYHTIRYDFKPASLEECKESYVEFGPKGEAVISMPKVDAASGDVKDVTLFKGSRKPHQKECLLIFDHGTREFTLEELTYGIQVKQVRNCEEEKEKTLNYVREIRNACKFNSRRLSPIPKRETDSNNNADDLMMSDNDSIDSSDDEKESSEDEEDKKSCEKEISDDNSSGNEDDMAKILEAAVATAKKKLSDHLKTSGAAGLDNQKMNTEIDPVKMKIEPDDQVEIKQPDETKSNNGARSSHALRKDILDNDLHLSDDSSDEDED